MHALLAALALTAIPSRAAAADDPLALTLAATSGGCRGDEAGAARLACASRKAQGAVEALELFRARAASAEDRNKAAALVAPELAPFFRDRDSALDALYRTLAVLDDSRVLAAGNDSCSARARRAVLLGSSDGLFTDPRTGRSSAWLTRLLGAQAAERSAASALDAAAGTPLADADYERLRARARELSRRILQNGADRSALCERARAYTALASAHRFARLTPAGRETSAATDPAASVLLLVRLRAGGYDALGAAVAVDGPRGPRLLTDARLVLDPATGHALTDLATVRLDAGKLSAPAPWTPARADASAGLAEGPVPDGVPALALAEGAPRERDLVSAIGQSGASSLWGRTQGLVSRVGGDWFATDAAVDVGMTGAAVLNADGRLAGVLVLRAARTTDERRLDWPTAVSAPALRRWLSGDALAAPAGPLDVAGLGTASIAGGAFIDASTSWNEGCGGVGTYIPELNQTIHATCAADCDCSSPSPSPQPSSPAPQAAPSAPAGPDYAQQFGAQMGQMMGQYLGNMIGQALFGGGGAAAAPPQAPVPVPRAPSPPPKSERPQDERKIIGLKLTLDPPDPQPGQTATLTAQLLFNGDDYEDKANVDIDLTAPETGEARFLDPMAGADDDGQKSVSLQTDADGKAVVRLKIDALRAGASRRTINRKPDTDPIPVTDKNEPTTASAALNFGTSSAVSAPALPDVIVVEGLAETPQGRFHDHVRIHTKEGDCPEGLVATRADRFASGMPGHAPPLNAQKARQLGECEDIEARIDDSCQTDIVCIAKMAKTTRYFEKGCEGRWKRLDGTGSTPGFLNIAIRSGDHWCVPKTKSRTANHDGDREGSWLSKQDQGASKDDQKPAQHDTELGTDPNSDQFRQGEADTAKLLEAKVGLLTRDPTAAGDWVDKNGTIYDGLGPVPDEHFNADSFNAAIDDHVLKQGVDKIVINLTGLTSEQQESVLSHVQGLSPELQGRIILLGTR